MIEVVDGLTNEEVCDATVVVSAQNLSKPLFLYPLRYGADASVTKCQYTGDDIRDPTSYEVTLTADGYQAKTVSMTLGEADDCGNIPGGRFQIALTPAGT